MTSSKTKEVLHPRLASVDNLQGMAMCLVVLGHLLTGNFVPEWYANGVRPFLYAFHMALFIFISGFLIRYSYRKISSFQEYRVYVFRRWRKFFLPFLVVGTLIVLLTAVTRHFSPQQTLQAWLVLLLSPCQSQAGFLWYIYILFLLYLISPLIFEYGQAKWRLVVWILAVLAVIKPLDTGYMALNHFCHFFVFYLLGVEAAEHLEWIKRIPGRYYAIGLVPFLAWSVWFFHHGSPPFSAIAGLCSIPAFAVAAYWLTRERLSSYLLGKISFYCFVIYLLHMFVIHAGVRIAEAIGIRGDIGFILYMTGIVPAAIVIPILLKNGYSFLCNEVCRIKKTS